MSRRIPKPGRVVGTVVLITLLVFPLSSCATLFNGTQQLIPFNSQPQGAEVWVDGELKGVTPLEVELGRRREHQAVVRYRDQEQAVLITNSTNRRSVALDAGAAVPGGLIALASPLCNIDLTFGSEDDPGCVARVLLIGIAMASTPFVIDAATGAWFDLEPSTVFVGFE